ncbi:MAG: tRNA pseudouridine(38-40) synthase TruA [Oscillospiraceae bacterium]|jgi:tRNA pseudouridine38-40 synthase|nr:tRNA pseudouridine(38-40) synthase TruA [Oscillospiraceae bacterium]
MNTALRLAYDGAAYHGWQRQKSEATVQQTLENAVSRLYKREVTVIGCGRTDAGVHAERYCANFRAEGSIPPDRLPLALNALLPQDISVYAAAEVEEDFHAVFSCLRKEYTYRAYTSPVRDPFLNGRALFFPEKTDIDAMRLAAERFKGTHDFAAVRSVGTNVKTTVRTVYDFEISRSGDMLSFRICANGFLYNMARAMVGTVLYVGLGKLRPEDIDGILDSRDRCLAGPTVPPHGLYMTGVWYEGKAGALFADG